LDRELIKTMVKNSKKLKARANKNVPFSKMECRKAKQVLSGELVPVGEDRA
jgi:hypothetical protein